MANIQKKGNAWLARYKIKDEDGMWRDKSRSFPSKREAIKYAREIEEDPSNATTEKRTSRKTEILFNDLLDVYIKNYGLENWKLANYSNNVSIINYYIKPYFDDFKLKEITTSILDDYFCDILSMNMKGKFGTETKKKVTLSRRDEIKKRMKSIFKYAYQTEYIVKNPMLNVQKIKTANNYNSNVNDSQTEWWDVHTAMYAINNCESHQLKLAMMISFACSLRIGEVTGLTWDNIIIDSQNKTGIIEVKKQMQRVNREVLEDARFQADIYKVIDRNKKNKTVTVITNTKTKKIRRIPIFDEIIKFLNDEKCHQEKIKALLGTSYHNHNLVIAQDNGFEISRKTLNRDFQNLIKQLGLKKITYHGLRHSCATAALHMNGYDYKATQALLGHSKASTTIELYAHTDMSGQEKIATNFNELFKKYDDTQASK